MMLLKKAVSKKIIADTEIINLSYPALLEAPARLLHLILDTAETETNSESSGEKEDCSEVWKHKLHEKMKKLA